MSKRSESSEKSTGDGALRYGSLREAFDTIEKCLLEQHAVLAVHLNDLLDLSNAIHDCAESRPEMRERAQLVTEEIERVWRAVSDARERASRARSSAAYAKVRVAKGKKSE